MKNNEFLSPEVAAERLGVSTATFLKWIREGHVAAFRRGRKTIRVNWPEVLESLRNAPPESADEQPGVS